MLKVELFPLQIDRAPEQRPIQVLATDGLDQSLQRNVGKRFDFGDLEDSKIGLPLMESIEWLMV
jgi:hypothetical protein